MALERAAAESALRSLSGLAGHVEEGGAVQVRLGHGVERVLQLEDLHHHGVGVREEQPHLREEPPHVEVVGLLARPRLRPEGAPVALHHVRQGQDVGVEVAVVELAEGQPVVLSAHRLPRQHAVVAVLLPHRGHLPRLGAAEVLEGHGQLAQDAVPRLLQLAVRPLLERPSLRRRARQRAQLQLGVKRGHQREELRQLLVRAGLEVVDHAGQARGEDVHAVHKPQRAPPHLQALLAQLAEDSEAEVAVVALLDRGLQGAPAGEGLWRGLGLGLWRSLGHGHGPLGLAAFLIAFLIAFASLSLSLPSSSRES